MSAHKLLSLLRGVKPTGPGRWVSRCPAHEDKRPSLAIRQLDDARILIHCFAGCATGDILAAVGLTMEDLFPERQDGYGGVRERRPFSAIDILRCISFEALIVAIAANNLAQGVALPEADVKRLQLAAGRLQAALEVANGDA
jgi:hypothetical protein